MFKRIPVLDTVILLIFVGWVPTRQWCVLPAVSRLERIPEHQPPEVLNVIVHGLGARSLTTAARLDGSLKELNHSANKMVRLSFGLRHLAQEVPDEAAEFTREGDDDFLLHQPAVEQVPATFVESVLGFPGEITVEFGLALLADG